ncbi:GNAT family acetyltransferase [Isoptericola sp. NEAU-Y5]|uniref:GNAT family acetyltransferase n=1 Tax=Isoptericola luteus TaxID=2879484 RepID=A0ABS7ZC24_9MICO|nr:GNAT family acetyltransferase [Isoptericola sp. NEAU-Y5]MCA5892606.1 GNAT family acetyltransferase [Isoptericola sp. NEAU-Y5]
MSARHAAHVDAGVPTTVDFRDIADADVEQVVSLWETCGLTRPWNDPRLDVADARANPTSTVLVGVLGDEVLATAMVGYDGHRGWLYYLAVSPGAQRSGLGRATTGAAESWLRDRGVRKLRLMVRRGNEQVLGFYEGLGYADSDCVVLGRDL